MMTQGIELLSVHIPKTGGVTFGNILTQVYGREAVVWDYDDRPLDPKSPFNADHAAWLARSSKELAALPDTARVVHGHFPLSKYHDRLHAVRSVVWVRDPVRRLISHYAYWMRTPPDEHSLHRRVKDGGMGLLEFAEIAQLRNCVAEVFLRDIDLRSLYFVGVQEHFAEDVRTLAGLLSWPTFEMDTLNVNDEHGYQAMQISDALYARVADLNRQDMKLYRWALAERRRRKRSPR